MVEDKIRTAGRVGTANLRCLGDRLPTVDSEPNEPGVPARYWRTHFVRALRVAMVSDGEALDYIERHLADLLEREGEAVRFVLYRTTRRRMGYAATGRPGFSGSHGDLLRFAEQTAGNLLCLPGLKLSYADALGIGLAMDLTYSYLSGTTELHEWERMLTLLERAGFLFRWPELDGHGMEQLFLGVEAPEERRMQLLEGLGVAAGHSVRWDSGLGRHVRPLLDAWFAQKQRGPRPVN